MTGQAVNPIKLEALESLGERIIGLREATFEIASADFSPAALIATYFALLDNLQETIEDLPAGAFDRQPDDVDGSDVWSAGEVIGHLAAMEISALPYWEAVTNSTLPEPDLSMPSSSDRPLLDRRQCLAVLVSMRAHNEQMMSRVLMRCTGDETGVHFALGHLPVRAGLLGTCLHLLDHLRQIQALDGQYAPARNKRGRS